MLEKYIIINIVDYKYFFYKCICKNKINNFFHIFLIFFHNIYLLFIDHNPCLSALDEVLGLQKSLILIHSLTHTPNLS